MELLFSASMAEGASVAGVAEGAVEPFICWSDRRAGCAPIKTTLGHPPFVFTVVVVRTGVALTTHSGRFTAGLGLVSSHYMKHV